MGDGWDADAGSFQVPTDWPVVVDKAWNVHRVEEANKLSDQMWLIPISKLSDQISLTPISKLSDQIWLIPIRKLSDHIWLIPHLFSGKTCQQYKDSSSSMP